MLNISFKKSGSGQISLKGCQKMQLDVFFFDSYSLQSKFMGSSISAERNSL
jgi:hypothetical protein